MVQNHFGHIEGPGINHFLGFLQGLTHSKQKNLNRLKLVDPSEPLVSKFIAYVYFKKQGEKERIKSNNMMF